MKYDFVNAPDRTSTGEIAIVGPGKVSWAPDGPKEGCSLIPMWVADMNFACAPSITEEITRRMQSPTFGYFLPAFEYYEAIINWQKKRNGVMDLTKADIGYENGVLGGLISVLQTFLQPGDSVLVHGPTYIGFSNSIKNAGFTLVHSQLELDEDGVWRMNYQDMDEKIKANNIKAAVFCNPHNPCGRVWEQEELEKALEVYEKNGCIVISDEIWSDLIMPGYKHIPLQSVNDYAKSSVVALYAPSKTFSIAGMVGSYHIIYNEELREKVRATSSKCHYNDMNVLSMHGLIGAYSKDGQEWLEELLTVLSGNIDYAYDYIRENWPEVKVSKPQGTYMMFLDFADYCQAHGVQFSDLIRSGWDKGVCWQDGRPFGGSHTIRINLALPLHMVKEAFDRIKLPE